MASPKAFWDTVMGAPGDMPYGCRLVPVLIDQIAVDDPGRVCFSYPHSSDLSAGFRDVTFREFARAINKTAYFIHREVGTSSMFETVLYMGHPDIRHFIVLIALMKTGHKVLFSSHRNSVAGHADLIKKTECNILLHTAGFPISGILEKCRMETLCMPELDFLMDDSHCEHYPYTRTWDEAKHHPCMVIHTSGSTGLPKPVTWRHATLATADAHHLVPPLEGRNCLWSTCFDQSQRTFSGLPLFHGAGIATGIVRALYTGTTIVVGPPELATADIFADVLEYGGIDAATCVPVTLEEVATRPDVLAKLSKLKHVTYVGGHLSKAAGNVIAQNAHLYSMIASTETSVTTQHTTDREDWQYICINPTYNGIEMRPYGVQEDLYELVWVKNKEHANFQGVFKNFPRIDEYSMSDVYSKHPTKAHHWKLEARTDDVIIFRSGWNFNPIAHEHLITNHPAVQNCVLFGMQRDKPGALIELTARCYTEEELKKRELVGSIWPYIEEANRLADTTGQLSSEYIIFAKKNKPFAIAGKGTIQRKTTVRMYKSEIDALYASLGG